MTFQATVNVCLHYVQWMQTNMTPPCAIQEDQVPVAFAAVYTAPPGTFAWSLSELDNNNTNSALI
jgi:hypothetical protein